MLSVTRRSTLIAGFLLAACAGAAVPFPGGASAHDVTAGTLTISHPWSRATAATAMAGALYLTVANNGTEPDRLLGVSTAAAEHCELHLSEVQADVMIMRMVDEVEIPAGGTVSFAPKGAHVMLMGLKAPLSKGEHYAAILHFEKAGDVPVEVAVQGIADLAPAED